MSDLSGSLIERLRKVPLFAQVADRELDCLGGGDELRLDPGAIVATEETPADYFYVLLDGELRVSKRYGHQDIVMAIHGPGTFFGEVPILLDMPYFVTARTLKPCSLYRLGKNAFWKLLATCPPVASQILRTMATRVKNLEGFNQQREKLVSLGTMAAGLAHELNNPATAAKRAASHLYEAVDNVQMFACRLNHLLTPSHWTVLVDFTVEAAEQAARMPRMDSVDLSDREEVLALWLDQRNLPDGWKLAPTLAAAGLEPAALETLERALPGESLLLALQWLEARLTIKSLLREIEHSSGRISELVQAIKSYSYEGRAPLQDVDIHEGLESTLTMLGHKLKSVTVTREYDRSVERIPAYGNELNQVWTNLIDNAIDAVNGTGHIWIRTRREDNHVLVDIADDGAGIPPEIQSRLFEPFFTTKGVGKGTGLGLLISYRIVAGRHGGEIEFTSQPGSTTFHVRLPVNQTVLQQTVPQTASQMTPEPTAETASPLTPLAAPKADG